jgi:hypothetical protein
MAKKMPLFIMIVLFSAFAVLLPAQEKAKAAPLGRAGEVGLLFNFHSLLADILPYNDGFQSGVGAKFWLKKNIAIRGLLGLYFNSYTPAGDTVADTTTYLSLGTGLEYHPRSATISPYVGGLAGMKMNIVSEVTAMGFYAGGMAGVECRLWDWLSLFGEYQLRFSYDSKGSTLSLGDIVDPSDGAIIGLCVYF